MDESVSPALHLVGGAHGGQPPLATGAQKGRGWGLLLLAGQGPTPLAPGNRLDRRLQVLVMKRLGGGFWMDLSPLSLASSLLFLFVFFGSCSNQLHSLYFSLRALGGALDK